jgi:hypothetical protein
MAAFLNKIACTLEICSRSSDSSLVFGKYFGALHAHGIPFCASQAHAPMMCQSCHIDAFGAYDSTTVRTWIQEEDENGSAETNSKPHAIRA